MPDVMEEHRVETPPPRAAEPTRILDRLGLWRPPRARKLNRFLRYALLGVLAVVGIVLGVRWLAMQAPAGAETTEDLSLEAQWNKTIARLGIEPVFPPEEDLAVGDLFATVVEQDLSDQSGAKDKVDATPFLGKSVKLAHIDVRRDLEQAYALLPVFPDSTIPTVPADIAVNPAQGALPPAPGLFMPGAQRKALPMAAFPGLTISHAGSAAAGMTGGVSALFGFGSSREDTEKLILPIVETYGLPTVNANAVLQRYCSQPDTAVVCSEDFARKSLVPIVGEKVLQQSLENTGYSYDTKVRIFMVTRVYLVRAILNQQQAGAVEGGVARLDLAPETNSSASDKTSIVASPSDAGGREAALAKRLEDVEKQLASLQKGAAASYRSQFGREILLDQKFPRPVAIGYRHVTFEPKPVDAAN